MKTYRIVVVGDFDRRKLQRYYFSNVFKLATGFVRLGHHVLTYSDRDVARERNPLRRKWLGIKRMNRELVETVQHYKPHMVLFGHADMTGEDTFVELRKVAPQARLIQFNVDPTDRPYTMKDFVERAKHVDFSFITTAEPEILNQLAPRKDCIGYMPNSVDASVETAQTWAKSRDELEHDAIFLGNGDYLREEQVKSLQDGLPDDVRFHVGGKIFGTQRFRSTRFLETLATAAIGPSLPLDDTKPMPYLCSSNRIAQLLGQGLMAICTHTARLEDLYEDGILSFSSREDIIEKVTHYARDDEARRKVAEKGWRIAHERTSNHRVAKYILERSLELPFSEAYEWPTGTYGEG